MDFDIVWTYISDRPKKTYDMNISTACVLRSSGTIFQTTKHTDHVSTPCVAKDGLETYPRQRTINNMFDVNIRTFL
jgi:hypothetical protein